MLGVPGLLSSITTRCLNTWLVVDGDATNNGDAEDGSSGASNGGGAGGDGGGGETRYKALTLLWSLLTMLWAFGLRKSWERRQTMLAYRCFCPSPSGASAPHCRCSCPPPSPRPRRCRWRVHNAAGGGDVAVLPQFKGTLVVDEVTGEYVAHASANVRYLKYVAGGPARSEWPSRRCYSWPHRGLPSIRRSTRVTTDFAAL